MTTTPTAQKTCPRCGASFGCGAAAGACWCFELPHALPADDDSAGCLCPDCLREAIAERRREGEPPAPAQRR